MTASPVIIWIRQCFRLEDNPLLMKALKTGQAIVPVFIHSISSKGSWPLGGASQWWLHHSLHAFSQQLEALGSRLLIAQGVPVEVLPKLMSALNSQHIITDRAWDAWGIQQQATLSRLCVENAWQFECLNTQLLADPESLMTASGKPYQVFSPYWKYFQKNAQLAPPVPAPTKLPFPLQSTLLLEGLDFIRSLEALNLLPKLSWAEGFSAVWSPGEMGALSQLERFITPLEGKEAPLKDYAQQRNIPGVVGTSRLSPHLHFGEISPSLVWAKIQQAVQQNPHLKAGAECYLRELGWREFAYSLLLHFPQTVSHPLRQEYDAFPWEENELLLKCWQQGKTGYPLVDAGMRELWQTGWLHNRLRMVVASFLVKHLLQPWQEGSEWFWDTLVDADLANNTLGWQWAAGCGADAAPYFRIFNPILQSKKFDPDAAYIRQWVPEIAALPNEWIHTPWEAPPLLLYQAGIQLGETYPYPLVDHQTARNKALTALASLKTVEQV